MIFVFFCLTFSLNMITSGSIHVAANDILAFFLMAEQCSLVNMYSIFFTHSSADGHLGRFHLLAVVSSVAMNTGGHVSFRIRVFSRYMPRSGLQDLMLALYLTF